MFKENRLVHQWLNVPRMDGADSQPEQVDNTAEIQSATAETFAEVLDSITDTKAVITNIIENNQPLYNSDRAGVDAALREITAIEAEYETMMQNFYDATTSQDFQNLGMSVQRLGSRSNTVSNNVQRIIRNQRAETDRQVRTAGQEGLQQARREIQPVRTAAAELGAGIEQHFDNFTEEVTAPLDRAVDSGLAMAETAGEAIVAGHDAYTDALATAYNAPLYGAQVAAQEVGQLAEPVIEATVDGAVAAYDATSEYVQAEVAAAGQLGEQIARDAAAGARVIRDGVVSDARIIGGAVADAHDTYTDGLATAYNAPLYGAQVAAQEVGQLAEAGIEATVDTTVAAYDATKEYVQAEVAAAGQLGEQIARDATAGARVIRDGVVSDARIIGGAVADGHDAYTDGLATAYNAPLYGAQVAAQEVGELAETAAQEIKEAGEVVADVSYEAASTAAGAVIGAANGAIEVAGEVKDVAGTVVEASRERNRQRAEERQRQQGQ